MKKINYGSSVCVVVMNFNMRFKTIKQQKNVVFNYGNRGISWHGDLIFYSV